MQIRAHGRGRPVAAQHRTLEGSGQAGIDPVSGEEQPRNCRRRRRAGRLARREGKGRPPFTYDDGSPDRAEIAAAVARFGNRVTLVEQANLGAAAARNRGMTATSAEFIALLDADDEWFPAFLEEQLAALTAHPHVDLIYCDGLITGQTGLAGQRLKNWNGKFYYTLKYSLTVAILGLIVASALR